MVQRSIIYKGLLDTRFLYLTLILQCIGTGQYPPGFQVSEYGFCSFFFLRGRSNAASTRRSPESRSRYIIHISVIFKDYGFSLGPFLIMLYIATILVSSHILGLMMVTYGTNLVALYVINNASYLDWVGALVSYNMVTICYIC